MNGPEIAAAAMRFVIYPWHLVAVNLLWLLGTVLGGVVLGAFPATYAAGVVLDRLRAGDPTDHLLRDYIAAYREGFGRMARVGLPFWGVAAVVYLDVLVLLDPRAAGIRWAAIPILVVGAVVALSLPYVAPVAMHYRRGPRETIRLILLAPFASFVTAAVLAGCLAAFWLLAVRMTVLIPLIGVSGPIFIGVLLVRPALTRLDERAAEPRETGSASSMHA